MTQYRITLVVDEETLSEIRGCPGGVAKSEAEKVATVLVNGVRSFYDDPVRGGHWQCQVRELNGGETAG